MRFQLRFIYCKKYCISYQYLRLDYLRVVSNTICMVKYTLAYDYII